MTYSIQIIKLFFAVDDHIFRIKQAEVIKNPWKIITLLGLFSVLVFTWMSVIGIGSSLISNGAVLLDPAEYELQKFWFIIGRVIYSLLFVLFILFLSSLLFYWVTKVPYKKLVLMQVVVLFVMLIERLLWIPLVVYAGLDWYVSPFSFGIMASYITDISFLIYFFGAISIFQIWIIGFQIKFLCKLSAIHKGWIWSTVILFHVILWTLTAVLAYADVHLMNRWFE
ncbi:hypothetical protein [Ornithinibacillus xuwenensis]|uniref:Yip1 domain-containing protein n=1 Tax=Ornithinibacillus xuwenensis TaxID=3144668 RepID=A0ABU9XM22_9BACI